MTDDAFRDHVLESLKAMPKDRGRKSFCGALLLLASSEINGDATYRR